MASKIEELRARLAAAKEKANGNSSARPVSASVAEPEQESVESAPVPAAPAVVSVQTELQSTTLVVVERPVESADISGTGNATVSDGRGMAASATNLDTSNPVHANFLQRLADLERALLERDPLMKTHLGVIHKTMIEYEEIPSLLTIDEIRKIMEAQQQHTGVILRAEVAKSSKASATKKSAQIKLEDI